MGSIVTGGFVGAPVFRQVFNVMMVLLPRMNGRLQLCLFCFSHPRIDVLKYPSNTKQETSVSECREKQDVCRCYFSLSFTVSVAWKNEEDGDWLFEASFFQKPHISISKRKETVFSRGLNGGQTSQRHCENAGAGNGKRVILWIVQKTMFQAFVFSLQLWFRSNNDTLFNIYVTLRWENFRVFFALFRFIFTFWNDDIISFNREFALQCCLVHFALMHK